MPFLRHPRNANWRHALAEFLLIVAGVLAALGADAWWENRQEHERERTYLAQIVADTRENERRLEEVLAQERVQLEATKSVLGALRSAEPISADSARAWLSRRAFYYSDPRLLLGTFEALLQTGDINLLRDDRVRSAVIAYASQVNADMAEFGRWIEASSSLVARGEIAVGDVPPGSIEEEVARYILAVQDDPQGRIGVSRAIIANGTRIIYVERMLEDTRMLRRRLEARRGGNELAE